MLYEVNEEERKRIQTAIEDIFGDKKAIREVKFTGSTISPYNIKTVLLDNGFVEEYYDENSYDYWWSFTHPKYKNAVVNFCAESFELKLYRKDEEDC